MTNDGFWEEIFVRGEKRAGVEMYRLEGKRSGVMRWKLKLELGFEL
jgi:hypothetical protein